MQEIWVQPLGWEDPLEMEIATHSSILAWEIPWTEEPNGLQSMESQRVGHNLVIKQQHSNTYDVLTLLGLDLYFSDDLLMLSTFSCTCWLFICLLWKKKMSIQFLRPFFNQIILFHFSLLNCMSSLFFFNINPLSKIIFTHISSHFIGCLFILFL